MTEINFIKMHGLGNDFVIIDLRNNDFLPNSELIRKIANRRTGVGCDQLVTIDAIDKNGIVLVSFYNEDGSKSGACGNATRCLADLIMQETKKAEVVLNSAGNLLYCNKDYNNLIRVNMGIAKTAWKEIPLKYQLDTNNIEIDTFKAGFAVNVGNPHIVFFVADLNTVDLLQVGFKIENNELFPERVNVNIAKIISKNEISLKVWERGAGATLACGTGACATAFAAYKKNLTEHKVKVILPGGELFIEIMDDDVIFMTGTANYVFSGKFKLKNFL